MSTRYFCDHCDKDMTTERYERYSMKLWYANGKPGDKERYVGLICESCVQGLLRFLEECHR